MTHNQILEMVNNVPADYVGECDTCHHDDVPLWVDQESPGEFADCCQCWKRKAARLRERELQKKTSKR